MYTSKENGTIIFRVHIDVYIDYTFDEQTFKDVDKLDSLEYTAYLGEDDTSIPDFLSFNGQTRRFQGTPRKNDVYNCTPNHGYFWTQNKEANMTVNKSGVVGNVTF